MTLAALWSEHMRGAVQGGSSVLNKSICFITVLLLVLSPLQINGHLKLELMMMVEQNYGMHKPFHVLFSIWPPLIVTRFNRAHPL